jgi:hypothetical protein
MEIRQRRVSDPEPGEMPQKKYTSRCRARGVDNDWLKVLW